MRDFFASRSLSLEQEKKIRSLSEIYCISSQ
jgi:hypothetical protein